MKTTEKPTNRRDIHYVRLSAAISASFGVLLLRYLFIDNHYLLVSRFSFLLVSAMYLITELAQRASSSPNRCSFQSISYFVALHAALVSCTHLLSILFGADLAENVVATFVFSCHISSFAFIPLYFHVGSRSASLILAESRPESYVERCALVVSAGVLTGAWLGAFVIPLDWDRDWQKWPIPCVIGSIFGSTASNLLVLLDTLTNRRCLSSIFDNSKIKLGST